MEGSNKTQKQTSREWSLLMAKNWFLGDLSHFTTNKNKKAVVLSDTNTIFEIYYAALCEILQTLGAKATIGKGNSNYL